MGAALLGSCVVEPPVPLPEFPDVPAYPGSVLQSREPADVEKPATSAFYQVDGVSWTKIQKFYVKWMPEFGWKPLPSPTGNRRDPNYLFARGDLHCVINARDHSPSHQFAVYQYPASEAPR